MAPPEEVDVFKVPHRRMKELVNYYCQKLSKTDFSSNRDLGNLLKSLETTFSEFKIHEQIENDCIMNKLQRRLEALSIQNEQVCEVHSHNQLSEMLELVAQGYRLVQKGEGEMTSYGKELRVALENFTRRFLPHMKEEEEVFQPLLMEYFSYEELKDIKSLVIKRHCLSKSKYEAESKEDKEKSDEDNKSLKCRVCSAEEAQEEEEVSPIQTLPSEVLLRVMSYLSPRDLCRCAQVCRSWSVLARDGHLWQVMHPARWAQGDWRFGFLPDEDPDDLPVYGAMGGEEEADLYVVVDEDADFDESAESDNSESSNLSYTAACIQREAKMLTSMVRNLLPHVSRSVQSLVLRGSRGLTNGLVYKLIVSCPNLEYLDLSHTNVSDVAFKGLGKRGAGRKLWHLDLSGCVNITNLTLIRLSNGLGPLPSSGPGIPRSADNNKREDVSKYICCDFSNAEGNMCCTGTPYSSAVPAADFPVPCHSGCAHSNTQFEDIECCEGFSERTSCVSEPLAQYQRTCCGGAEQRLPPSPPNNDIASSWTCCMSREESRPFQRDKNSRDNNSRRKNNKDNDYADNDNVGKRTNNCSPTNGDVDKDFDDAEVTRGLIYLGLSGCYQITDEGLSALASHGGLPQLTHLDLSGCLNITAEGLAALADSCRSLDHQQFYYCDNITDGPFSDTASGCQNLQCSSRVCCRSGE
ncbi:PREDICTED: F-box/LRR-repeat protein 5-like [Branchiostoma belcheri]|uniref:F-box/LRR-repeat protein 5 n=1 Tax=Branchiostoma belcheri TaxID=7741 RepID=A0A6P4YG34_BRABE|nr:PREDICTED: F-box/LRR-repeat protein 5-like [Branchiostoma belcheri]